MYVNGTTHLDVESLTNYNWDDMVTFYFGCSFSFEKRLLSAGIPIRNIEEGKNVSMYTTNISCFEAGPFSCNMVVSMRPLPENFIDKAVNETLQMDFAHGAPIHIGNPADIGIEDLHSSETIGDTVTLRVDDIPVFWACGVTSGHAVGSASKHAFPLYLTPRQIVLSFNFLNWNMASESAKYYFLLCFYVKTDVYGTLSYSTSLLSSHHPIISIRYIIGF